MTIRVWFWPVYFLVLLGVAVAGTELVSSFWAPSWPARDLRPIPAEALRNNLAAVLADSPKLIPEYNSWALRDRPRSITRPPDVGFRSVLVGDSFLEGPFVAEPLPALVERHWAEQGQTGMEAINLGIAATGPRQYYYRIKHVALALQPDVIVILVFAGNDFISDRFDDFSLPPLIDELPVASLLGAIAPRTTWLAVNRLGLSEIGRGNKDIPGEFAQLNEWAERPAAERIDLVARHMKKHYFPDMPEETIAEVLSRGGMRLWRAAGKRQADREFVAGWLLSGIISWETGKWSVPDDAEEADRQSGATLVSETLGWLAGAEQLAREHGSRLMVALAPVGAVDPNYVEFWRPWPRYFSYSLVSDARHKRLAEALRQRGIPVIDLREDLDGVRGSYRLTDGHWTELGTRIAAERMARELLATRKALPQGHPRE